MPVEDSSFIINKINDAVGNCNKTLMDVQSIFFDNFRCINNYYLYLYPYEYDSSYISGAVKPKKYTDAEYKEELDKATKDRIKEKTPYDAAKIIAEEIYRLRKDYAQECIRYIKQQRLYEAFQRAANDSSVKMYSKESVGWDSFEYVITNDLKVCVNTNFGYGCANYFTLSISYKGIVIAPLSHIVKYYYANIIQIISCTRNYRIERKSWRPLFEFVAEFVNHSLSDPESFVQKYIMNEVDEMMKGLRDIMYDTSAVIDMFKKQDQNLLEYRTFIFIRPMSENENQSFSAFPDDMPVVFKSEKLMQATKTVEKLRELGGVAQIEIDAYIDEIINMVTILNSETETTIEKFKADIKRLIYHKECKEKDRDALQIQVDELNLKLYNILKELPPEAWQERNNVSNKYKEDHPEYDKLLKINQEISGIMSDIYSRESIVRRLQDCIESFASFLSKAG